MNTRKDAYLVLQDGTIFKGYSFGDEGYTEGEVVFNTGMTGYQEILSDPSYYGQIVTMTYPQIGNYGAIPEDNESKGIQVRGFIVKEYCDYPNNYRNKAPIGDFLKTNKIIGIEGIDTRALTKKIRNSGTMLGFITTDKLQKDKFLNQVKKIIDINKLDLVKEVTSENEIIYDGKNLNIGILDFGMKFSIAKNINKLGHKVTVMPALTGSDTLLSKKFDLVLLSNGPGDPGFYEYAIKTTKELIGKIPLAGICLGHQILGLALGGRTYKLKFGHRGSNHPVKNLLNGKVWISTQNHGFAVDVPSLPKNVEEIYINLNDNTNEGLMCREKKIYSVQYHPEAGPGPYDCHYIFQEFIDNLLN